MIKIKIAITKRDSKNADPTNNKFRLLKLKIGDFKKFHFFISRNVASSINNDSYMINDKGYDIASKSFKQK